MTVFKVPRDFSGRDIVERLRVVATIRLGGNLIEAAKQIRALMVDRMEAANEIDRLRAVNAEMLAALKALAGYFPTILPSKGVLPNGTIEQARAAIAKAECVELVDRGDRGDFGTGAPGDEL